MLSSLKRIMLTLPLLATSACSSVAFNPDFTVDFGDLDLFDFDWDTSNTTSTYLESERVYFDVDATIETVAGSGELGTDYTRVTKESEYQCSNTGSRGGDGGLATDGHLNWPTGVAVDEDGTVLIADQCNDAVRSLDADGTLNTAVRWGYAGPHDSVAFPLAGPGGVEVTAQGHRYIVDTYSHTLLKLDKQGQARVIVGVPGQPNDRSYDVAVPIALARLRYPTGVAEDSSGRLFIANYWGSYVLMVEKGRVQALPLPVMHAGGLATDNADNLYIVDNFGHNILKRSPDGTIRQIAGNGLEGCYGDGGPAILSRLNFPTGVRVRPDGVIFFTDTFNHRVAAITTDGNLYTVVGNGELQDQNDHEFGWFAGDGGDIRDASLNQPYALDFDADGNLLIADAMNNRIRKVTFSGHGPLPNPTGM